MSHDLKLSAKQILKHYTKRWPIETFFRETKQNFGLARYQVRTLKGIKRLMLMIQFVYLYLKRVTKAGGDWREFTRMPTKTKTGIS